MSYRCGVCKKPVPPGKTRRLHTVRRPDGSILREIPVCDSCAERIASGRMARIQETGGKVPRPAPSALGTKVLSHFQFKK